MTDPQKALVGRARKKRTQARTRKPRSSSNILSLKVLLVTLLLWKAIMLLLHLGGNPVITELTPGQIAPFTVQAEIDFETVDLDATELRRERAMNEVPPVLAIRTARLREAERNLQRFLQQATEVNRTANETENGGMDADEFAGILDLLNLPPGLVIFPHEIDPELQEKISPSLTSQLREAWQTGVIAPDDQQTAFGGFITGPLVQVGPSSERIQPLADLLTPESAARRATRSIAETYTLSEEQARLVNLLLGSLIEANLILDGLGSRQARLAAAQAIDPVLELRPTGTTLVEARNRVTEQNIQDLQAHAEQLRLRDAGDPDRARIFSEGILLFVGLSMSLAIMVLLQRDLTVKLGRLILWGTLTLLSLLLTRMLTSLVGDLRLIPPYLLRPLLPLALAPLLGTILHGPRFALAVGISTGVAISLSQEGDLMIFFYAMAVTLTAAIGVRSIHKRSNLFRAGLWIGGIKGLVTLGIGISDQVTPLILSQQIFSSFLAGLLSAVLVLLLIPPFEFLFKLTTDIRLLELSDMGHPLLSRLAMEAPGTYHHSLMVAHLAQAAAREIGANDLLVRVSAYYHDIGKLTKPEFFIENIQGRPNPHDELSPSMSRLIVISHVKEGVSLAHRYKLPRVIIDGIEEHHGTSVIQYFYHRARTRAEGKVDVEDYRYPGPRPKSRETGILLMADTIEAASRSVDKNKPGQVEGLVHELIREKLLDGQLDLCGLTMADINAIRRSFIFSLNNMLHGRVVYPKQEAPASLPPDPLPEVEAPEPA